MTEPIDDRPGFVLYPDGVELPAVPYGTFQEDIRTAPGANRDLWRQYWAEHDPAGNRRRPKLGETCHDCGCAGGAFHMRGCDMEWCPRCAGQLIGCGCLDTDEDNHD